MKKALLAAVIATLAVGAFAGQKPKDKAPQLTCPVTGGKIDIAGATKNKMFADYKGRRYFFCCNGCPQAFKKNPAKYAKVSDSIPTPKAEKGKKA